MWRSRGLGPNCTNLWAACKSNDFPGAFWIAFGALLAILSSAAQALLHFICCMLLSLSCSRDPLYIQCSQYQFNVPKGTTDWKPVHKV